MTDIDSILHRIRSGLEQRGRKVKVARFMGIEAANLSRVDRPDWNPSADQIRKLDTAISTLFPAQPVTSQPQD